MISTIPSAPPPARDGKRDTILTLPETIDSLAVAHGCRSTGLVFLNEAGRWGKAELAMWLMAPYAQITRYALRSDARRSTDSMRPEPELREIDARMVDRVIHNAREEVIATLQTATNDDRSAPNFTDELIAKGFVARCEDRSHAAGWVPTGGARRLADRVISLFAADYLVRPGDYATDLLICGQCSFVEFDPIARQRGICHRHGSGFFVPRGPNSSGPILPEGA